MAGDKKKVIKRKIDQDVVSSLDDDLKKTLMETYTDILIEQEQRKRDEKIELAKKVFETKKNLVKNLGSNDKEREELLALVSSFPSTEPETDKGWSRVLGIMERGGKKKNKRVVEFPASKTSKKKPVKKSPVKKKSKTTTNKK